MKWSTAPASTTNLVCFCADCTAANCTDGSSEDTPALMSSIDMTGAAALLLASCSGDHVTACITTPLDVAPLGQHILLLGLAQLHRYLIAATSQFLVVLALVLEGLGAAVGRGLAFLCGSGHPEACEA